MAENKFDKIPMRMQICLPWDDTIPRLRALLARGKSKQLHALLDKIDQANLPHSKTDMYKSVRYHNRYINCDDYYAGRHSKLQYSAEFIEVLNTILCHVPTTVLFEELFTWGYETCWHIDLIAVTTNGMPRTNEQT